MYKLNITEISMFKVCAAAANSLQLCPTLCDPIDGSPPGSLVPGILQARTLEWVAISFSSAWKWKVKVKSPSRVRLFTTPGLQPTRLLCPWDFPGKSTGVGCHCLLWIYGVICVKKNKGYKRKLIRNSLLLIVDRFKVIRKYLCRHRRHSELLWLVHRLETVKDVQVFCIKWDN